MSSLMTMTFYCAIELTKYLLALMWIIRLELKYPCKYLPFVYIPSLLLIFLGNLILPTGLNIIIVIICAFIDLFILFKGNWFKNCCLLTFTILGLSVVDLIGDTIFSLMNMRVLGGNSGIFFSLVVILIFHILNMKELDKDLAIQQYIILSIGLFGCLVILTGIQWMDTGTQKDLILDKFLFIGAIVGIVYLVITIRQFTIMSTSNRVEEENKQYEQFIELQENKIADRIRMDEKLRSVRHDMRAHIIAIETLAKQEKYDELEDYLDNIKEASAIFDNIIYSGIVSADAIIQDCMERAEKQGIKIDWNGRVEKLNIDTFEFCILISNLLNNAIEACSKLENTPKNIQATLRYSRNKLYLCVKNPIEWEVKTLETSKKDKTNHGIGIKNVKRIVEKCNGTVSYDTEDKLFKAEIFI